MNQTPHVWHLIELVVFDLPRRERSVEVQRGDVGLSRLLVE
jgi:hypothetical protein